MHLRLVTASVIAASGLLVIATRSDAQTASIDDNDGTIKIDHLSIFSGDSPGRG